MFNSHLGVNVHGKFTEWSEAAGVASKVCEISLKRAFCGAILRTTGSVSEHFLLLGESLESVLGPGAVGPSCIAADRPLGDAYRGRQRSRDRSAFPLEYRHRGAGASRLPGGDPLPG